MSLSEHEQRILAEIEQQLAADDPSLAARARRQPGWSRSFQVRMAIAIGLLGVIATALLGVAPSPWGIISAALGMAMIFGAILLGATAKDRRSEQDRVGIPPDDRR